MTSKRNDLTIALAAAGLLLAFYWNKRTNAQLRQINARLAPGLVPDLGPNIDPSILPGVVEPIPLLAVDPVNRPGVAVNVYSGDSSIYADPWAQVGVTDDASAGWETGIW